MSYRSEVESACASDQLHFDMAPHFWKSPAYHRAAGALCIAGFGCGLIAAVPSAHVWWLPFLPAVVGAILAPASMFVATSLWFAYRDLGGIQFIKSGCFHYLTILAITSAWAFATAEDPLNSVASSALIGIVGTPILVGLMWFTEKVSETPSVEG